MVVLTFFGLGNNVESATTTTWRAGQPGKGGGPRPPTQRDRRLAQYYNEPLESPWNGSRLSPEDDWASSSEARLAELKLLLLISS